ncbi:hypothetical protein [Cellulomonas palmilytica]|uniref:hypothetical protein n=1 Tax=Cellulomonas palmilytica TaxID=2608402 RepID=UPI001F47849A|nr:hypothetical protein [Cellulomonas palmilytica]UJP39644.1 hypothetical protein F1D97_15250 [Cellulomonas palmilytica]
MGDGVGDGATSALGSMWAWDNPVPQQDDARGRGYAPAAPAPLAAFATRRALERVHLAAPWAADEGPVGTWFGDAARALRAAGVAVGALGGDPGWLDQPALAATWAGAALRSAGGALDAVQLDVEPWTLPAWQTDPAPGARAWLGVLDATRAALPPGVVLGADTPWWLTTVPAPDEPGTLLDAVLRRVDRALVVAFADHAGGEDGIVALAGPAVAAARAAGVAWSVGVETDTPAVAGGAQFTFYDEGEAVLEREAALVARAFEAPRCVCVEHHRAWRHLLGLDARPDPRPGS